MSPCAHWTALMRDSTSDNLRPVVPRASPRAPIVLWLRGACRNHLDYALEVVGPLTTDG